MDVPGPGTIAILFPLKNYHPRFLSEALSSVIGQTSGDWRLVIIVEPEDVGRFTSLLADPLRDPRVTMLANRGRKLAGALNTGMQAAQSEFVTLLLSDDLFARNTVAVLQQAIRAHPEADFLHSDRQVVNDAGDPISAVHAATDQVEAAQFVWKSPVHHLLCWRRTLALAAGGMDESLNNVGPDDYDFPWVMLEQGAVFQAVHECLYLYRDHQSAARLTTHLPRSVHLRELRRILRKHRVPRPLIRERIRQAKRSFLKQCLYRNEFHRWIVERLGLRPRPGARLEYR